MRKEHSGAEGCGIKYKIYRKELGMLGEHKFKKFPTHQNKFFP